MRVHQEMVALFQERYGYAHPERPTILSAEDAKFRSDLLLEELREYQAANAAGDMVEVADGLADQLYILLGTCVYHGIDIQPIFEEVHRSNMTKDVSRDGANKPTKGPTFESPRIASLLFVQMFPEPVV